MKKVLFSLLAVVLGAVSAFGQTVTGQVLDSQREPIIGAGIVAWMNGRDSSTRDKAEQYITDHIAAVL